MRYEHVRWANLTTTSFTIYAVKPRETMCEQRKS
jgi:hypothetical protein